MQVQQTPVYAREYDPEPIQRDAVQEQLQDAEEEVKYDIEQDREEDR